MNNKVNLNSNAPLEAVTLYAEVPFVDFHYNNAKPDYTARISEYSEKRLTLTAENGVNVETSNGSLSVNGTDVSLSTHNHDNRYPKWYGCSNVCIYPATKIIDNKNNQYSEQLILYSELNNIFGVNNCDYYNTICFVSNGDWASNEFQCTAFAYKNGWHVRFTEQITGNARINFLVLYFT